MAQEDKGLVLRGLVLFAGIGVLVTFVLTMLFTRQPMTPPAASTGPERLIPFAISLPLGDFPAGVPWGALVEVSEKSPAAPGWEIRYNAATTLARRGSSVVPWPLLREMLDEPLQMRNARVRLPDGKEVTDEAAARSNIIGALKAIAVWHAKQKGKREASTEMREIYAMVEKLTQSPIVELKTQAETARATFFHD